MLVIFETALTCKVVVDLLVDDLAGQLELGGRLQRLDQLGPRLDRLIVGLDARRLLTQIHAQLLKGVELGGELGEVVVGLGELTLLDGGDLDRDQRGGAGVVTCGQRALIGGLLARRKTGHGLVQAFEHVAGAHLVGGALHRIHVVAVHLGGQVQGHEVLVRGGTVHRDEGAKALAQGREAGLDIGIGDGRGLDLDGERRGSGQGELGTHLDGGHELQALIALDRAGNLGDLDLGLAIGADVLLLDRGGIPLRQAVVHGMLDDGALAHALLQDLGGHLALAESGDGDLLAHVLVSMLQRGREILLREGDRQLDGGRVDLFKDTGHCYSCGWTPGARTDCASGQPRDSTVTSQVR